MKNLIQACLIFLLLFCLRPNAGAQEKEENEGKTVSSVSPDSIVSFRYMAGEEHVAAPRYPEGFSGFSPSSVSLLNQFGSFGFRNNGFRLAAENDRWDFYSSYFYQNYNGYLEHSQEYWNILEVGVKAKPSARSSLRVFGEYYNATVRLPGALTKSEFQQDPYRADPRAIDRDEKNIPTGGKLDLEYETRFGRELNNKVTVKGFADLISFQSATREYRVVTRYAVGLNASYSNTSRFWGRTNQVTCGINLKTEPERVEYYDNYGGQKGDLLEQLNSQKASKAGVYVADTFELMPKKIFVLLDGHYQYETYSIEEQTLPSRSDNRIFTYLTPELGLQYKPFEWISLYGIANLGYKSPADIQLSSPDPFYLYNPTLIPQTSLNYQLGIRFRSEKENGEAFVLPSWHAGAAWFQSFIDNEIVPYEVFGDIFFRNAQKSLRYGLKLEAGVEIIKGLRLDASYVYSHFRYDTYLAIAIETDTTGNIVQVNRDFSGNYQPGVPENYFRTSLGYDFRIGKKIDLLAKLSYTSVSSMWVDDLNSDRTDVYGIADALLRCNMKFGHFRILATAGLNNLFNSRYAGYVNVNSANSRFYVAGAPLNFACNLNLGYVF